MKVVHLTSVHPPFDTRIFFKQCRTLAQHGYDVVLVAPGEEDQLVDGVAITAVKRGRSRLGRMTTTAARVFRHALAEKADLYHVHDPELLPVAQMLRLKGEVVVYDMHENVPSAIRTKHWIPRRIRAGVAMSYRGIERMMLSGLPTIFAERSYTKDYAWLKKSQTVLNLPDLAALSALARPRDTPFAMAYVGAIGGSRGFGVMIEVLRRLRQHGLEVELRCVGAVQGEQSKRTADGALAESLPLRLFGRVDPPASWELIAGAGVGLALLKAEPNYLESYPTKLFEYMALGIPVVVSDFPVNREVVESAGCGFCVDPGDVEAVARAVAWLYENPEEAREMGARGQRAVAERYSWQSEAEGLIVFYEHLLGTASRRLTGAARGGETQPPLSRAESE